jgi:alkanesulfonate monooxygenase SsuD/methylene tetrahydromethanopterin reductase-like flavin-dependent oxidoreductase (luciferase family)
MAGNEQIAEETAVKFGLFDHVDRSDMALADQFDRRLEFVARADDAGFYGYHVAEHHATPLNMVPVPGVYLGAVAQATRRIRLGPLVYLLPLYSPLRLIEEVCILDHLCHGRLEVGVGRGVSPFELNYHNVDAETSRAVFEEALAALRYGLTHETLDFAGDHFSYRDVPMELKPLQQPHPPIWYPSSSETGAAWCGAQGFNFATLGSVDRAKACIDAYRAAYELRGGPAGPALDFPGGTAVAVNRHVVIADSDEEALHLAAPAYDRWYASLMKLWRENKVQGPGIARDVLGEVSDAIAYGSFVVGSPATVRTELERQIDALGVNYMILGFYFGTLAHDDALRSLSLFTEEVMPALGG